MNFIWTPRISFSFSRGKMCIRDRNNISIATAEIGTRETLLDRAQDRLEGGLVNLKERQKDLEAVDLAGESINNKAYEAAWMVTLQLGSSLIPPSIFDFMK